MSLPKFNPRTLVLFLMVVLVGALRVLFIADKDMSPISTFSPLGAMALFGGAYFSKHWKAFGFPLLTLFISDVVLSFTVYAEFRSGLLYSGWYWTYAAFALMALAGRLIIKKVTVSSFLLSAITCVVIHWLITDIGMCATSGLASFTWSRYAVSLVDAIPYELNLLAGTVAYGAILFGAFEWMQRKYTILRAANI